MRESRGEWVKGCKGALEKCGRDCARSAVSTKTSAKFTPENRQPGSARTRSESGGTAPTAFGQQAKPARRGTRAGVRASGWSHLPLAFFLPLLLRVLSLCPPELVAACWVCCPLPPAGRFCRACRALCLPGSLCARVVPGPWCLARRRVCGPLSVFLWVVAFVPPAALVPSARCWRLRPLPLVARCRLCLWSVLAWWFPAARGRRLGLLCSSVCCPRRACARRACALGSWPSAGPASAGCLRLCVGCLLLCLLDVPCSPAVVRLWCSPCFLPAALADVPRLELVAVCRARACCLSVCWCFLACCLVVRRVGWIWVWGCLAGSVGTSSVGRVKSTVVVLSLCSVLFVDFGASPGELSSWTVCTPGLWFSGRALWLQSGLRFFARSALLLPGLFASLACCFCPSCALVLFAVCFG